jgi:hypothetical protein
MLAMPDAAILASGSRDQLPRERKISPYAQVHPDEER